VKGTRNARFLHNTFAMGIEQYQGRDGKVIRGTKGQGIGFCNSADGTPATGIVRNNIFYNSYIYWIPRGNEGTLILCSGNLLFCEWHLFSKKSWETDIVNEDPLFRNIKNIAGEDGKPFTMDDGYVLTKDSPCIDSASEGNENPRVDIFGVTRPQGKRSDIGAYEVRTDER